MTTAPHRQRWFTRYPTTATERPFERVMTVTDYFDGPRRGIAHCNGLPHLYDSKLGHHSEIFELRAVDDDTLRLALEDWQIWLRWEAAFHADAATIDTHPALPEDRDRHDELARTLDMRLASLGSAIRVRGEFRRRDGRWEVQWLPA